MNSVVLQIDLVEGAFEALQGEVAVGGFQLTFPQDDGVPAEEAELDTLPLVALAVALYLGLPEGDVGLGEDEVGAILMAVPEASVDEDGGLVFAKHDVGCAGQALDVYPIAESAREEVAAHHHLGLRVSAADALHASAALFGC